MGNIIKYEVLLEVSVDDADIVKECFDKLILNELKSTSAFTQKTEKLIKSKAEIIPE